MSFSCASSGFTANFETLLFLLSALYAEEYSWVDTLFPVMC